MFGSSHVLQLWKGIFPSNASRWCCRAAARSAPIRPESTKRWLGLAFIPIGWLASRSVPSTARSLPGMRRKRASKNCAGSGSANPWRNSLERTNGPTGDAARARLNQLHAGLAVIAGTAGFFAPRYPPPWLYPSGTVDATSFYDTRQLKDTLERFVDFDRLNAGAIRLSVGTVNVRSGNFIYFDTQTHTIGPQHIMASGALPPATSTLTPLPPRLVTSTEQRYERFCANAWDEACASFALTCADSR
jgi:hypothetical protein